METVTNWICRWLWHSWGEEYRVGNGAAFVEKQKCTRCGKEQLVEYVAFIP
jgi:hypothetical protein